MESLSGSIREHHQIQIQTNRSRQTNISASQKYSDKVQKRMNRLLITWREFKNHEEKSSWTSYVKYPAVLMVKKPEDQNYSVCMVSTDQVYKFFLSVDYQFLLSSITEMLFHQMTSISNNISVGDLGQADLVSKRERIKHQNEAFCMQY